MNIHPADGEIDRIASELDMSQSDARALGTYMLGQVSDRFRSQGAPGQAWRQKSFSDGRAILTGPTGDLKRSFRQVVEQTNDVTKVTVQSDMPYAAVNQVGTRGKGGKLPDIVPVKAKALFIPLTPAARNSQRVGEKRLAVIRGGKLKAMHGQAVETAPARFKPLKQGKFKDGKIVRADGKAGKPDFIFLRKVSIPARPMLPDSQQEIQAQGEELVELFVRRE